MMMVALLLFEHSAVQAFSPSLRRQSWLASLCSFLGSRDSLLHCQWRYSLWPVPLLLWYCVILQPSVADSIVSDVYLLSIHSDLPCMLVVTKPCVVAFLKSVTLFVSDLLFVSKPCVPYCVWHLLAGPLTVGIVALSYSDKCDVWWYFSDDLGYCSHISWYFSLCNGISWPVIFQLIVMAIVNDFYWNGYSILCLMTSNGWPVVCNIRMAVQCNPVGYKRTSQCQYIW
jgi:hypothetical protein